MPHGTTELTRVLRELFDRFNRLKRSSPHSTVARIKNNAEAPPTAERVELDDTQPSATPKWGDAPTWSRANNNVRWDEGAKWQ